MIIEMVLNHTSDQHPWFQEARSSRDNPSRDWYVWSDTDTSVSEARESSSSTPRCRTGHGIRFRKSYYWHRFFSHQPDLNYDNPAVREADVGSDEVLAGTRRGWLPPGRGPLPDRARRHVLRKSARNTCRHQGTARQARRRISRARCCWRKPTSGRPICVHILAMATSSTWPSISR